MASGSDGVEVHPYVIKIDLKLQQLDRLANKIFDIADCNLLLTNEKTGDATYDLNLQLADKLDKASTIVKGLATRIAEKATSIRDKVAKVIDEKTQSEDIHLVGVMPPTKKIKTEVLSESDDENTPPKDKRDAHFRYAKVNENDPEIHSYICNHCQSVHRDRNEMRNHMSQHHKEFYTCLQCKKIFRTIQSFEQHQQGHTVSHTCQVCGQFFRLKSSLKNHSQVHLDLKLPCSHANCSKTFKQRSSQLMHIQWDHKTTRDVKCTHCDKYYASPNKMRSHRYYKHGIISDITPGHPYFGLRHALSLAQQLKLKREKNKASKKAKSLDDPIPTSISGPLASPPAANISTTDDVQADPIQQTPVPKTPTPGRKNRNRSRSRTPGRPPAVTTPPQTRQLSRKNNIPAANEDINDDDLPDINI